tara:strand:- start:293 stop:580 length:288 start_codon:yes stop_codon:yes gene_type:complete
MSSDRPIVIYPEYFDYNLKRSEGRKVPLSEAVRSPKLDELSKLLSKIDCNFKIDTSNHSGNWSNMSGCLKVNINFSKTQLIHKLGSGLKELRKTN